MFDIATHLGSLRARVALLTTLVACAAVAAMAWYAGHVSASAWRRQLAPTPEPVLAGIARQIADDVGSRTPDWRAAQRALDVGSATTGKQLVVFDSTRRAVASSPSDLLRFDVSLGADGTVSWQRVVTDQDVPASSATDRTRAIVRQRVLVANPRGVAIDRGPGIAPARLVEISAPISVDVAGDPPIVAMLRRSLFVGVGVAIAGALLVALVLSARVAAPIERLTQATRTLASGDRTSARLTVSETGSGEVAELSRAFNGMVAELDRQESLRRGMTSDIAHELRTPLTNIRCQIESMIDGLEAPTAETLASLHEECLGLQQLIDDLQDMAYGDQGRLTLALEPLDVGAELATVVRPFQQRAATSGSSLRLDVASDVPAIAADRRRFRQIVSNLIANALSHTPSGCITISASRDAPFVAVEVSDTGAGISAADLPNVFERFYRADPARARAGGGAGLGLAIVKQLVELQGGRVSITSTVGRGTTVRFTIPIAASQALGASRPVGINDGDHRITAGSSGNDRIAP